MPRFTDSSAPAMTIDGFADKEKRMAYDVGNNLEYVGYAQPGSATSASIWHILKLTYDGSDNLTRVQVAGDNPGYKYSWDDRATFF